MTESSTSPVFLRAEWRFLAMLTFEIAPEVLSPHLPRGTELDSWRGKTLASLVGFRFLETRVLGCKLPFHVDFDEVNLRFYVRRSAPEGVRRGVVFVKEIVPRRLIAFVARTVYNENYVALPMRNALDLDAGALRRPSAVSYAWRCAGAWAGIEVEVSPAEPALAAAGSIDEFVTEHYWGYVRQRDGGTVEYAVEHPRWLLHAATSARLEGDVASFYGEAFSPALRGEPQALVAVGSPVLVRRGVRIA